MFTHCNNGHGGHEELGEQEARSNSVPSVVLRVLRVIRVLRADLKHCPGQPLNQDTPSRAKDASRPIGRPAKSWPPLRLETGIEEEHFLYLGGVSV